MKIILVGETHFGSRTPQRVRALERLGHLVSVVSTMPETWTYETRPGLSTRIRYRLRIPADLAQANAKLLEYGSEGVDVVILDNAKTIRPVTLRRLRQAHPKLRLIWYSEDDMMNPIHRSRWIENAIPLFDLWVTTKTYNAEAGEIPSFGAGNILTVDNSFDPDDHHPIQVSDAERERWGAPVSFVGTYESPRAGMIRHLGENGVPVRVWGNGWARSGMDHPMIRVENTAVYGDQYRQVVASSDINLCFLRHGNRDRQTCRSVEIPAMGGFMAHEASNEMERILHPGTETVYFENGEDLLRVCYQYLNDQGRRHAIAKAGMRKIREGGYSHDDRWRDILEAAFEI